MMIALSLVSLFCISVIIPSIFANKYLKAVLAAVFGLFFCMEISSLYLGSSFVDYKYYFHFNIGDTLAVANGFIAEIAVLIFSLIAVPYFFYVISLANGDKKKHLHFLPKRILAFAYQSSANRYYHSVHRAVSNPFVRYSVLAASLFVMYYPSNGIYKNIKEIYDILSSTNEQVENIEASIDSFMKTEAPIAQNADAPSQAAPAAKAAEEKSSAGGYTKKRDLTAEFGGKNIVILSLESFEKAFLHDANKHLSPNLRALKDSWVYTDMTEHGGSGWTAGSLYTVFTGFPCYFTGNGNSYFQNSKECKIVTVGDVLKKCGYTTYHLSNSADFAGTRDLLKIFRIDSIMDGTFHGKYQPANMPWKGAGDRDIFSEAKEVARKSKKPFFIFLSTLSTHHPNGFVDDKMLQYVQQQKTTMETAAVSTDWLVGDFLAFLEKEGLMKNTVVYIFPDHLMHCGQAIFDRTKERRGLWFMTNADKNDLTIDPTNFYQIDLAKNILSGAKITHNAKFLSDFITGNKAEFMSSNLQKITTINSSSIIRERTVGESLCISVKNKKLIVLSNKDTVAAPNTSLLDGNKCLLLPLDNELRFLESKIVPESEIEQNSTSPYVLIVSYSAKGLKAEWLGDGEQKIEKSSATQIKFDSKEIQNFASTITPKFYIPNVPKATAGGTPPVKETTLVSYLTQLLTDDSKVVLISAYDDGSKQFASLMPLFEKIGLKKSLVSKFRWSYLSAFSRNTVYCEDLAATKCYKKIMINSSPIYLNSGGSESHSPSNIIVNNKEYSMCRRGLNVVVYNSVTKKVEDSFNVDAYGDPQMQIIRN